MSLGQTISRLRTERRLTQDDLADQLEVSRQSVSKWETDASVPELEKLVRMADLFGVSLDELVRGKTEAPAKPADQSEPSAPEQANEKARPRNIPLGRLVLGGVLLAVGLLGILLLLLFAGLDGLLFGLMFLSPFLLCGMICLNVRRRAGLWCAWAVYIPQQLYWTYATGITWRLTFWTMQFTPEMNYMRLAIGWLMLLAMLGLLIGTSRAFRNAILEPGRKSAALCIGLWLLFGLLLVPFPLLFDSLLIALREIVRLAALTAALAVTLARLRGRRAAR